MGLRKTEATGLVGWVDQRLSIMDAWNNHLAQYWTPKNFNIWYFFGSLALLVLVNQILTGIWLTMSYEPSAEGAFASVEYIMRDVEMGWLIRYMHSTGASPSDRPVPSQAHQGHPSQAGAVGGAEAEVSRRGEKGARD